MDQLSSITVTFAPNSENQLVGKIDQLESLDKLGQFLKLNVTPENVPPILPHKRWAANAWVDEEGVDVPPPMNGETWQCRLSFKEEGIFVAKPVEMLSAGVYA